MSENPVTSRTVDELLEPGRYEQIVADLLAEAQRLGASAAEAALSIESGLSVTVRLGEVETVEHNRDKGLGITVYFGHSKGSASTSDFSPGAVRETVRAACDIARYTEEDPCAGLAPAALMATDIPELQLYHPWALETPEAIERALACETVAREHDSRITNSEGASITSHSGLRVYANSHGFIGAYPSSRHSMSCTVIGQDESGMQRDYWYTLARDPQQLDSAESVGVRAAERTVARLGARKIPTCQVPVMFEADVARGLLGHLVRAISGGALYRNASFLVDARGQQLFPERVHVDERPHLPGALGSAPFDNEGVATAPRTLIEAGVLQGYVLDSYSGCRLGLPTTGNAGGVHNLYINHDALDREQLIKKMDRGLLVTDVMGQGVNTVTGDYSRGAAGFWVENGQIQYPVDEVTLGGRLQDMYRGLQAVGNDTDARGNIITGSWLIDNLTVAGD
ncbi:metalloprotease PmbA [Thiohalophilus sp.]|uniref:metalloprotease PmbA n=1 Tax=Thiohalophilus sp. TaxID=3028392 RepID=UPI003975DC9A